MSDPKRRRIEVNDDDDDDDDDSDIDEQLPRSSTNQDPRAARIARRMAERRSLRQTTTTLFPGDDGYDANDIMGTTNDNNNAAAAAAAADDDEHPEDNEEDDDIDYAVAEEEEEEGEDLLDHAERDYQRIDALDTYGTEGIDNDDYDGMDLDERRDAEKELDRRDRFGRGGTRTEGFLAAMDLGQEGDEDDDARRQRRAHFDRVEDDNDDNDDDDNDDDDEDLDADDQVNLEAFDVPLREWIAQDRTRNEITRKFRAFLKNFTTASPLGKKQNGMGFYEQNIRTMCANNLQALQISYLHLMEVEPVLAFWVADAPKDMLQVLNEAATRHVFSLFSSYHAIHPEIHVRISSVPILDSLRDLRRSHLDCLVKVGGVVTRRSAVYPQLQLAHYVCQSCLKTQGPFRNESVGQAYLPTECPFCEQATMFKLHTTLSQYRNFQRLNLQETPGSVPPGRVPRTKEIVVTDDLIDLARPGEEVEVTGIYEHAYDASMTMKSGFPVFSTYITANHVCKKNDESSATNLSPADLEQIAELAKDPQIGKRIVQSMAPSIYGHDMPKMALAMALFGGVAKNINDKHRIRGDCNVLLLGDPGTAKSQFLKYAEHTAPRAVYSTGKGASAVGLTASVHKDPITKEWTLEGGALVLADRGVCLIDEFDKMNEQDRTSIHEAMEQQSISISKAGIVTSLQARCAVIAAANPIGGRYDASNTLKENVELTDPILQRFDILCVLQDQVDPVADERLARFVTSSHMRAMPVAELMRGAVHPEPTEKRTDVIPQDLLKKYIQYARQNCHPVLNGNTFDKEKVASLYVQLRQESAKSGGVPIAVRHVESIMRMSEAHAKMHLRDYVRNDDMNAAISTMLDSFLVAQKFSVRKALRKSFAKFLVEEHDQQHLLLHLLSDMFRNEQMYQIIRMRQNNVEADLLEVPLDELEGKAQERRMYDLSTFLKSTAFSDAGYVVDLKRRVITRALGGAQ
jgi:DNA replication licensing factor MCM2